MLAVEEEEEGVEEEVVEEEVVAVVVVVERAMAAVGVGRQFPSAVAQTTPLVSSGTPTVAELRSATSRNAQTMPFRIPRIHCP